MKLLVKKTFITLKEASIYTGLTTLGFAAAWTFFSPAQFGIMPLLALTLAYPIARSIKSILNSIFGQYDNLYYKQYNLHNKGISSARFLVPWIGVVAASIFGALNFGLALTPSLILVSSVAAVGGIISGASYASGLGYTESDLTCELIDQTKSKDFSGGKILATHIGFQFMTLGLMALTASLLWFKFAAVSFTMIPFLAAAGAIGASCFGLFDPIHTGGKFFGGNLANNAEHLPSPSITNNITKEKFTDKIQNQTINNSPVQSVTSRVS